MHKLDIKTEVNRHLVSTVLLFNSEEYETMVFRIINGKVNYEALACRRTTSLIQAAKNHVEMVDRYR